MRASSNTASPATSRLRPLDLDGRELPAPLEWAPGLVDVDVPAAMWERARLECNSRPLPLSLRMIDGASRVVAEWPRSGTGHYELRLSTPEEPVQRTRWTVKPRKISAAAYSELLQSLETRLPASIVLGLQRLGALTGIRVLPPAESTVAQELARLRRAVGGAGRLGLAELLPIVGSDPHRVLAGAEMWVPRDRARRVDPSRLAHVVASGRNLAPDGLPKKLPEARVEESVDVYENRLLKTFHEQVVRRLRRLHDVLAEGDRPDLIAECESLLARVATARHRAEFLDGVGSLPHLPDRLTMVLLRRPEYRYALEGYLELHRSVTAHLRDPALDSPLEELPSLYETWGVLQVVDALLAVAGELGYTIRRQRIAGRDRSGVFVRVLPDGQAALVLRRADGTTVRLVPQRTYPVRGEAYRSVSYRQRPDAAIEVERPGARASILLFDPKYKLDSEQTGDGDARPKKADIDTMHAYRDAIRDGEGRRIVEHASILYPGPSIAFAPGLGALAAVPDRESALRDELRALLHDALDAPGGVREAA